MENRTIAIIKNRTSTRKFLDKKVPLSKLNQILDAGKMAPSGMNRQICRILAIRKNSMVNALRELSIEMMGRDCYYGSSTIILVYGPKEDRFTEVDSTCILENMFIATEALKLGSCWINQSEEILCSPKGLKLRKRLGISEEEKIVGTCIVGYPNQEKTIKERKEGLVRII